MIQSLKIENYAIIEKVEIYFDETLNIITGETGAGKSILLGALSLIMGQRADSKVLYNNDLKCVVEAVFNKYPAEINELLEAEDLDVDTELIIRREIATSGKSRAFLNDTPVKLDLLQKIAVHLVDLNSQFEITEIQNPKFQLDLIDALADNRSLLHSYQKDYKLYRDKTKMLSELEASESTQNKEIEFIKFQFNELDKANLVSGELNELESEAVLLEKAEEIKLLMNETGFTVSESEQNIKDALKTLYYKWENYGDLNPLLRKALDRFVQIDSDLEEIIQISENIANQAESDPKRLAEIQSRKDVIYNLQRKHNVRTDEELISIYTDFEEKISKFENSSNDKENLKKEITILRKSLDKQSQELSNSRKKVFPFLEKEVNKKMSVLSMVSAEIKVDIKSANDFRSDGKDEITILFKANKGTEFLPIKKIASGGESSRLMLSIKSTVAHIMQLPTMIFDEIDTGVSGDIAGKMGNILKGLSSDHQLISITHSPQVASRAVRHFFVYKEEKKDRTVTYVKVLSDDERIVEIAKMLSGNPPTTFALENAKELIRG